MNTTILNSRIRSKELIAEFENGYVKDWVFRVNECHRDSLDIKLTERKVKGVPSLVWTQGHIYNFQKGDLISDYIKQDEEWSETLKHINYSLQIETAAPCFMEVLGGGQVTETDDIEEEEKEKKEKEKKQYIVNHGYVKFNVFTPNPEKTALELKETKECTQVEFISILKNGLNKNIDEINSEQIELSLS